jgi:hypothetical protein
MEVILKYHGELIEYFSDEAEDNIIRLEINKDDSVYSIIEKFNIPPEKINLVLVNGVKVNNEDCEEFLLSNGDILAVWPVTAE